MLIGAIVIIIAFYIVSLIRANTLKKIKLNIKGSDFIIKQGDIFLQEGLKVINFIEYFDTIVDNKIIAKNSLNGKFITEKVKDLEKLDSTIDEQLLNFICWWKRRGNGICRKLMNTVKENAKSISLNELYLYTKHVGLYEKFGWKFIEEVNTFKDGSSMERLYKLDIE